VTHCVVMPSREAGHRGPLPAGRQRPPQAGLICMCCMCCMLVVVVPVVATAAAAAAVAAAAPVVRAESLLSWMHLALLVGWQRDKAQAPCVCAPPQMQHRSLEKVQARPEQGLKKGWCGEIYIIKKEFIG